MTPTQLFNSYTEVQDRYQAEKMKNRQHEIVLEQARPGTLDLSYAVCKVS